MKSLAYLLAALVLFTACKARKVDREKKDSTSVAWKSTREVSSVMHLDTSKNSKSKQKTKTKTIIWQDSSSTKTIIHPVPGTNSIVDPDGTFHGQARDVVTQHTQHNNDSSITDFTLQENAGEIKGNFDQEIKESDLISHDSTKVKSDIKKIDAKPSPGTWPWAIIIGIAICLIIVLFWFFGKPKTK